MQVCNLQGILESLEDCKGDFPTSGGLSQTSQDFAAFTKFMKKGVSFIWDDACQQAFEKIKRYLTHPPVLTAPMFEIPFLIYV